MPRATPCLMLVLLFTAGCGGSGPRQEQQRLIGTWNIVHLEDRGLVVPKGARPGVDVTIDTAHLSLNVSVRQLKAVYVLHPGQTPRGIDLAEVDPGGKRSSRLTLGIYTFEGQRLKLCLADPGRARPTEFKTSRDSGTILLVLQRDR